MRSVFSLIALIFKSTGTPSYTMADSALTAAQHSDIKQADKASNRILFPIR